MALSPLATPFPGLFRRPAPVPLPGGGGLATVGAAQGPPQLPALVAALTASRAPVQVPQLTAAATQQPGLADKTGFYSQLGAKLRARQDALQAGAAGPTPIPHGQVDPGAGIAGAAAVGPLKGPDAGIAKTALTQIGIPYQWGGKAVLGGHTDCSGLLQASAAANGINIGRTTYEQWKQGAPVPLDKLQPGDAVFAHMSGKGPEHVMIYAGNGMVVEDPHTGDSVKTIPLAGYPGLVGARRY